MDILPLGVLGRGSLGLDSEGVGTEVITLSLEEVGGQVFGSVAIKPRQGSGERGDGETKERGLGDDVSPAGLSLVDGLVEEVVKEEVLKVGVVAIGGGDVLEEDGADNTATTPHEGNGGLVELPAVLLGRLLHKHEALGVGDDLGGIEGLLEVLEELLLVTLEGGGTANKLELGGSLDTLLLDARQAASEHRLGNEGDGHAQVQGVDGSPLAGTLLAGLVEDLLDERLAILIVEVHDVLGDLDQERVEDTVVPLGEGVTNLLAGHAETALHDIVRLCSDC